MFDSHSLSKHFRCPNLDTSSITMRFVILMSKMLSTTRKFDGRERIDWANSTYNTDEWRLKRKWNFHRTTMNRYAPFDCINLKHFRLQNSTIFVILSFPYCISPAHLKVYLSRSPWKIYSSAFMFTNCSCWIENNRIENAINACITENLVWIFIM